MSSANSDFCLSFLEVNGGNGRQPTYDKAVAVANALGVSADYLLTGDQKEKPARDWDVLCGKDKRLIEWFRSLPLEKQKAILISQDGPTDAV